MHRTLQYAILFIVMVILQIFLFSRIGISVYVHPLVCIAFIVLTTALALGKLLDLVEIAYRRRPDAPNKPIKGYLQLGKIVVFTVATILIVATLINRNPLILLSGPGSDKYVELAGKLLKQGVDALFCPGGNAGIVMLYAFSLYGRRVPEDISLIASEQTFFSHYAVPPQTTISPDYAAMAAATADIIEARLDGQKDATVSLHCDKTVAVDEVVKVMNIAKDNNYKLILATSPK